MQQSYFLYEQLADPRSDQVRARLQTKKQKTRFLIPLFPLQPSAQLPEGQLACERIGSFLHIVLGQTSPARQERESTTREGTWSWQQEAKQLRFRALELPGIDQCVTGVKRTMKLVA
jgi:hypothetical protein